MRRSPLIEGGDAMNEYSKQLKKYILNIIREMAKEPEKFITSGKNHLCRKRKWDFSTLMRFILSFGSNSLGHEVGNFFEYQEGFPTVSSFVQQRQKLDYSAFRYLFDKFNECIDDHPVLFKHYRLLAVDGSDLTLPYNPRENNVIADNHVSTLHLNALYDVCNKRFLDVVIQQALKENEYDAACKLVDRISEKHPVILLADRGFENYNLFAHVEERLFDYVIRVKDVNSNGILAGLELPDTQEFDVTKRIVITRHSTGPAAIMPGVYKYFSKKYRFDYIENSKCPDYEMYIRFVRFQLSENSYEVLATSLPEELFSMEDLKELYQLRWGIETGFRELKYILGLAAFHSKKENSILQEIFARLIMYNFSMCIIQKISIKEKDRSHQLQVNFTQATKICLNFFRYRGNEPPYNIETTLQRFLLPIRPNRKRQRITVGTCVVPFNYRLA